jgi:hypothetical protein
MYILLLDQGLKQFIFNSKKDSILNPECIPYIPRQIDRKLRFVNITFSDLNHTVFLENTVLKLFVAAQPLRVSLILGLLERYFNGFGRRSK